MDVELLPVLVRIQSGLDGDLRVATLARRTGWSESSLQRRIRAATGETPRRHVERLRLERAASQLLLCDAAILEVALDNGFASHEVFTRAFRRHFQATPSEWRRQQRAGGLGQRGRRPGLSEQADGVSLSRTRLIELRPVHVAFLRHVGPYDQVDGSLWGRVRDRLAELGHSTDGLPLGIAHDPPEITPPDRLRFDAAWTIDRPLPPGSGLGQQTIGDGTFAFTTYVGPFSLLGLAYAEIAARLMAHAGELEIGTSGSVEWYRTGSIDEEAYLNQVDISFPVQARAGARRVFE
ncbi:MAG TPA: AraC family transcriptional regulator [Candidatus Deferrimicrobium sp.]|nr:AraC family transcriptional regulator [Candidatus Deferrimicrobium sp.]